mgnify:CR=1 FL=1
MISKFTRPAGEVNIIRAGDEIMITDDVSPDVIEVFESYTQHKGESLNDYLERTFDNNPYMLYLAKRILDIIWKIMIRINIYQQ